MSKVFLPPSMTQSHHWCSRYQWRVATLACLGVPVDVPLRPISPTLLPPRRPPIPPRKWVGILQSLEDLVLHHLRHRLLSLFHLLPRVLSLVTPFRVCDSPPFTVTSLPRVRPLDVPDHTSPLGRLAPTLHPPFLPYSGWGWVLLLRCPEPPTEGGHVPPRL